MAMWLWMTMALVRSLVVLLACYVIATLVGFLLVVLGVVEPGAFEDVRKGLTALVLAGVLLTMWQTRGASEPVRK